ncbi:tRNA methyltransferase ppm2 [Lecanora helva]
MSSDPLAFEWLSKEDLVSGTKLIDVDFPDLISKKCNMIENTSQLRSMLGPLELPEKANGTYLRSQHYCAIGCDLRDLVKLEELLACELNGSQSLILCTAEVSVTYMNFEAADALIRWAAAHYDEIQFCLLEQYLPAGAEHPFARKMIQHFKNLQTPLRSVHKYPQLIDQEQRFRQSGWPSAIARSLWDIWTDPEIVTLQQKLKLNAVEPFDEWEEFVLFASHYFVLIATKTSDQNRPLLIDSQIQQTGSTLEHQHHTRRSDSTLRSETIPTNRRRRFGALSALSKDVLAHHGGLGPQTRLDDSDFYGFPGSQIPPIESNPEARMCHTISATSPGTSLLVGGRASPARALNDCWILGEQARRVHNLPIALYRHCATHVAFTEAGQHQSGVLVFGGKTGENLTSKHWFLWRQALGWTQLDSSRCNMKPRFGASLASTEVGQGFLIGGMDVYGDILSEVWEWSILDFEEGLGILAVQVNIIPEFPLPVGRHSNSPSSTYSITARMGACLISSSLGLLLVGGVSARPMVRELDIIRLTKLSRDGDGKLTLKCTPLHIQTDSSRLLLVGHSVLSLHSSVAIIGGGAVCFSFGTYWNEAMTILSTPTERQVSLVLLTNKPSQLALPNNYGEEHFSKEKAVPDTPSTVKEVRISSGKEFKRIVDHGFPVIIRRSRLGTCTTTWTLETLQAKIGDDREVVVHETTDPHLDFQNKNFRYVKKPLKVFVDEIARGSRQYLRSLASDKPSEKPADFWSDFSQLSSDFELPAEFDMVKKNMHSSVFRISGPVAMWLHYDVMANVLCQIHGSKTIQLYPPSDIMLFSIPPGDSSSSINCFDPAPSDTPSLASAHAYEALLEPGDVLFIPALWLHTALPKDMISISINAFFRDLDAGYAPGRDLYGNRDVQAYEKGRRDIEKIIKSFAKLPSAMAKFYLERLAGELKDGAGKYSRNEG